MTGVTQPEHCFVVPAYGESRHLDACLASLRRQALPSPILVTTSTPNAHIDRVAHAHEVEVLVNPRSGGGIGADWNFALDAAPGKWVTLAHQDDVYLPDFADRTMAAVAADPNATLAFSGYGELEADRRRPTSTLVRIKQVLLELGFLGTRTATHGFFKTNALRFGCAIPCPAVTINTATGLRFRTDLRVDLDWAAWLELAGRPGTFVYIREILMLHRVHPDSETTAAIAAGGRLSEDRAILRTLWPHFIADAIVASYGIAYRSNRASTDP